MNQIIKPKAKQTIYQSDIITITIIILIIVFNKTKSLQITRQWEISRTNSLNILKLELVLQELPTMIIFLMMTWLFKINDRQIVHNLNCLHYIMFIVLTLVIKIHTMVREGIIMLIFWISQQAIIMEFIMSLFIIIIIIINKEITIYTITIIPLSKLITMDMVKTILTLIVI